MHHDKDEGVMGLGLAYFLCLTLDRSICSRRTRGFHVD